MRHDYAKMTSLWLSNVPILSIWDRVSLWVLFKHPHQVRFPRVVLVVFAVAAFA